MPAFPGSHLPGPCNFPALNLARPEAWGASRVPGRVQGASAAAGAFRPAGPSCSAPARTAGRATWPFPGEGGAGRGRPRGGAVCPNSPRAPSTQVLSNAPSLRTTRGLDTPSFPGFPTSGDVVEITVTIGPFAAHNRNSTGQYPSNQLHLIHSSPDFSRLPAQPQPECRISWSLREQPCQR